MTASPRSAARGLAPAALLFVYLAMTAVFFYRFHPAATALVRLAQPTAAAVLVLLAALAVGDASLRLTRRLFHGLAGLAPGRPSSDLATRILLGVPLFGSLVGVLAWIGAALEISLFACSFGLGLAGLLVVRRLGLRPPRLALWHVLLLGPPVAVALVAALAPVNSPDELVYKLAVPRNYLLHGAMVELPLNAYSYVSSALSHASLAALALSDGIAAKLVHFALYLAVLVVLCRLAEGLSAGAAPWAVTSVAWTPALMLIAGWAWAEWAVLGLVLLSYAGWHRFRIGPDASHAAVSSLALAGAIACKYTGLLWLVPFALVVSVLLWKRADLAPLRVLSLAALVVAVFGSLFYVRNLIWTGSPVAPFLLPGSPEIGQYRSGGTLSGLGELLRGWDILHPEIVDDALGMVLPAFVLVSPLAAWLLPRARDLWWTAVLPLPFLLGLAPTSRLVMTSVVPLGFLGAVWWSRFWRSLGPPSRALAAALAALGLAGQLLLVLYVLLVSHAPLPYLLGAETRYEYLDERHPFMKVYAWIESHTPREAKLLFLGENRPYHLQRRVEGAGNFDGPRMARFVAQYPDARAFVRGLRRRGVTHLLVHWPWIRVAGEERARPPSLIEREQILELPVDSAQMLQELVDHHANLVYQDERYSVYELPAADAAPREREESTPAQDAR